MQIHIVKCWEVVGGFCLYLCSGAICSASRLSHGASSSTSRKSERSHPAGQSAVLLFPAWRVHAVNASSGVGRGAMRAAMQRLGFPLLKAVGLATVSVCGTEMIVLHFCEAC